MKLTDEQLNAIIDKADADLDRLKDRCHDLYEENQQLKERVAYLERSNDRREDTILGLRQELSDAEDLCDKYEEEHNNVFQEWKRVIEANEKAIDKIQYIIDYGFDYDGMNTVDSLKKLIDMLVDYAVESKKILQGEDNDTK